MRINMVSMYDHFPHHNPVEGEPYITCYNDFMVMNTHIEPNSIALLIEPRSLQPQVYSWMEENYDKFKLIFTHDSILLSTLPNARVIHYGGVWGNFGVPSACLKGEFVEQDHVFNDVKKTKKISFCSSDKEMCHLHKMRKKYAKELENKIDCMGTYNGGEKVSIYDIYADYMFSVVIENYIDDYWFTEKICNAFANKCVPIYYGARRIGDIFDYKGIIQIENLYELPTYIDYILNHAEEKYSLMRVPIHNNFNTVQYYKSFEDWFFRTYEGELNGVFESFNNK